MTFPWFLLSLAMMVLMAAPLAAQSGAERYLDMLAADLTLARAQMPLMVHAAELAAQRIVDGGTIYAARDRHGFCDEARGRAGGLMSLQPLAPGAVPTAHDVVLSGAPPIPDDSYRQKVQTWLDAGALVVLFGSAAAAPDGDYPHLCLISPSRPGLLIADGPQLIPTDTLVNIVNLWAWTGEFVAACTRLGHTPILYESIGMPDGRDRITRYQGKVFHDDITAPPTAPGLLGQACFDAVAGRIGAFRSAQLPLLRQTARWANDVPGPEHRINAAVGHLFPAHFLDARAPQPFTQHQTWDADQLDVALSADTFVLVVGYQLAPAGLLGRAVEAGCQAAYMSVRAAEPLDPERIIYLDPQWPFPDASVSLPGYDIPILPTSGVLNAAIYWSLVAEMILPAGAG